MQCYTELIPPSAVSHAVALPFLDSKTDNLVVAKTSLLQIFRVDERASAGQSDDGLSTESVQSRLVLEGEYPLAGTVTSLASITGLNTKSGGNAVLIAFRDAKLSLIEWDPENRRISTISIHYYEGENAINQPVAPGLSESENILTVDPRSRCAALKFGGRSLAILPFRQTGDELGEGGEDEYDPELDIAPSSATLKRTQSGLNEITPANGKQTPYKSSFILPLTALDPALTHPVDLSFLYEYREPTFGILSASVQPSSALIEERKDILTYTVFTLDLEQRASTNLISVQKLPTDLWKVVPLPLPVGGALLIGVNEFVHIDQSGRTNAVAVNEFAKAASNFGMVDQSDLNMKLENCAIQALDAQTGDLLVVLSNGLFAVLTFKILGRNIGGFTVSYASTEQGGTLIEPAPCCVVSLLDNKLFVGSEDGDSSLLSWTKPTATLNRKRSHAQMLDSNTDPDRDEDGDEVDEDDLYATSPQQTSKQTESLLQLTQDSASSYTFRRLDSLPALGPINDNCFGRSSSMAKEKLELCAAVGRSKESHLAFMSRDIVPNVLESTSFTSAWNVWSLKTKGRDVDAANDFDNMLCVYDGEQTKLYDIIQSTDDQSDKTVYRERTDTDFEHDDETLAVYTLTHGSRIVHCRRNEIRMYDGPDWTLGQIIPIADEDTDAELSVVHTAFCEPYILVLRDDNSIRFLKADESCEVEALEASEHLEDSKWMSACLYRGEICDHQVVAFLLGQDGGLTVFDLQSQTPAFTIPGLSNLPAVLAADAPQRRVGVRETLTEVLFSDIGTGNLKQPYLTLRSALDEITLYEPWRNGPGSWDTTLRFRKVSFRYSPSFDDSSADESETRPIPLCSMNIGGRSVVYIHGQGPAFIVKEATSLPKAIDLHAQNVRALTALHHETCQHGFALIDSDGTLQECQMPTSIDYHTGWAVQRLRLGDSTGEVSHVAFHHERQMYIVATCKDVDFYFPEDDSRHQEQDDISLRPQVPQYTVHLLSARSRKVIHSVDMPYLDNITSLAVMQLEISEQTHEQQLMVVVGTGAQRGEDMPAKGAVTVFELLDVVPDPKEPESGCKLHIKSREETRGAITALAPFSGGLVGTAQGQKIMIRGLKEDGSCLPVAFLDAQCLTTQLKTLGRTGMFLAGDVWKGLWFGGFTEEPYKLSVLGKGRTHMEVVAAEFLPYEGQLYLMVIDAQMDLHVLQYDPENPKSLSGTRLLHRSTMHIGQFASKMCLLPSSISSSSVSEELANGHAELEAADANPLSQILLTSTNGAIGLITPVDEATYRRLGSIQTQLTSVLEQGAGLNPRAYRAVESKGFESRGIIDGSLVLRINELGSARRSEVISRAGADAWILRGDLNMISGGGLGYL